MANLGASLGWGLLVGASLVVGARNVVESYGGRVALAHLVDGRSTSEVIQRMLSAYAP